MLKSAHRTNSATNCPTVTKCEFPQHLDPLHLEGVAATRLDGKVVAHRWGTKGSTTYHHIRGLRSEAADDAFRCNTGCHVLALAGTNSAMTDLGPHTHTHIYIYIYIS